jgi:hypothetical protein
VGDGLWIALGGIPPDNTPDIIPLAGQLVGVLLGSALLYVAAQRAGLRVPYSRAVAVGALVFLAIVTMTTLRESWRGLDHLRLTTATNTQASGKGTCLATGPDPAAVAWLARNMPRRARFFVQPSPILVAGGGTCIRFLLLPRLEVGSPDKADYVLFWRIPTEPLMSQLVRKGGTVKSLGRDYHLVRLP